MIYYGFDHNYHIKKGALTVFEVWKGAKKVFTMILSSIRPLKGFMNSRPGKILNFWGIWSNFQQEELNFLHFLSCEANFPSTERTNFPRNEVPQFPMQLASSADDSTGINLLQYVWRYIRKRSIYEKNKTTTTTTTKVKQGMTVPFARAQAKLGGSMR